MKKRELGPIQQQVLLILHRERRQCGLAKFAKRVGKGSSLSGTRSIKRLVRLGLVHENRKHSPSGRPILCYDLSETGRKLVKE